MEDKENHHYPGAGVDVGQVAACRSPESQALALASSSVSRLLQSLQTSPATAAQTQNHSDDQPLPARRLDFSPNASRPVADMQIREGESNAQPSAVSPIGKMQHQNLHHPDLIERLLGVRSPVCVLAVH